MGMVQTDKAVNGGEVASRECPNCHSKRNWKDGIRETGLGSIQRYICRECGFRFSHKSYKQYILTENSQLCAEIEAKKLETAQKHKFCVGDTKKVNIDTKGLLIQFYAFLEKEAYSTESDYFDKVKHLAVLGANLRDPENVKKVIGQMKRKDRQRTKNGTKMLYSYAYDAFTKMLKIQWECHLIHKKTMNLLFQTKQN
jgi:hypothetical protein